MGIPAAGCMTNSSAADMLAVPGGPEQGSRTPARYFQRRIKCKTFQMSHSFMPHLFTSCELYAWALTSLAVAFLRQITLQLEAPAPEARAVHMPGCSVATLGS